jgi:TolA-binding protein
MLGTVDAPAPGHSGESSSINEERPMGPVEKSVEKNIAKMEAQLVEWGRKIDELAAKTEKTTAEAKADQRKRLQELKAKRRAAQERLDELKSAGGEKWETFKVGIEAAWKDVEVAFKELTH